MHSDKESKIEKLSVLLLDVAGTTTSLEYVKEKLFAFILEESPSYLKEHIEEEAVKNALKELQGNDKEIDVDSSVEIIKKLTGENSDDKNLKFLQALIGKAGYEKGILKAHIYPDVKVALENWSKDKKVAVYSSGDIEAQKLIFSNSVEGNLTPHIFKFFDLSVGLKTAAESYSKISDELKVKCEEIVFVSDDPKELKAAKEAGLITALMKREGNEGVSEEIAKDFTFTVTSLVDLPSDFSNKRKVEDSLDGSETPPCKLPRTDETKTKDEVVLPKIDENGATENGSEEKSQSTGKKETEEVMEVDSTTEDAKKSDVQNVPTETSMDTEEVVGDKAVVVEPEKTEPEKSKLLTEKTNSDETDGKTETIDDTNKVSSVENSTEKTNDTEDTTSQEKQNEKAPTDNGVKPMAEEETVAKTNAVNSSKDTNNVEQAPELDGDKASTTDKVCKESVNVTEVQETNSKDSKLEETKDEPDVKTPDEVKEENEKVKESNHVEVESNDTKDETNDVKEKTIEEDVEKKDLPELSCVDKESVEEKNPDAAPEIVKEPTKENVSATKSQNGKISEVSNGVVNGQDSCDKSSNGQTEEATDIKVKKAETNVEAPAVAVEV